MYKESCRYGNGHVVTLEHQHRWLCDGLERMKCGKRKKKTEMYNAWHLNEFTPKHFYFKFSHANLLLTLDSMSTIAKLCCNNSMSYMNETNSCIYKSIWCDRVISVCFAFVPRRILSILNLTTCNTLHNLVDAFSFRRCRE